MAQQVEMTIEETKGKPKRNIHFWVIGLFSLTAILFGVYSSGHKQPVKEQEQTKPVPVETHPEEKKEAIAVLIRAQEEAAGKSIAATQPQPNSMSHQYNIPSVATQGVSTDLSGNQVSDGKEDSNAVIARQEEAKREMSNILVIDNVQQSVGDLIANGPQGVMNPASLQKQIESMNASDKNTEDKIINAALNAQKESNLKDQIAQQALSQQQNGANVTPAPSVVLDRQWSDQQANGQQSQQKVVEDVQNPEYTLFQGSVIPAVLISRINSDLPGDIIAQTTEDVYDGVHGNNLIIPKGSRIYGVYNNDINTGQSKIMVAFQRIVLPGGRSITLPGLPGMDAIGQTGVSGDVDNHFMKLYGGSALVAAFGAVVDYFGKNNTNVGNAATGTSTYPGLGTQVTSATGQVLVQMSNNMLQRNNSIRPTVTVEQGTKMNIFVKKDFQVKPY